MQSESLITEMKWTPIATQRSRKPQSSASIQGKPTLTACTGKITIINPVETSKCKFPKPLDNKFEQATVKGTLESQGTSQRTEKAFPEPEYLEEEALDTVVDDTTLRDIIPTLPFNFQFNRSPKTRGLEGYASSSLDPPTPQSSFQMDHLQQEVQPST
ncbi:hypothetical protein O181_064983 [Austropuccinia psidii MF-1]|uniref:Uncharacterized protein n=1 Tax=Austropuccinia psidii MF-1 TaxID=1389203 RepID=A0A9Q3EUJ8_9BASI|nr:hypothetical protein [Austropuccinia psidii MF-1]